MRRLISKIFGHQPAPDIELELIESAIAQELASLPPGRISLGPETLAGLEESSATEQPEFARFFERYCISKSAIEGGRGALVEKTEEVQRRTTFEKWRLEHPVLFDCADIVYQYLQLLSELNPTMSGVMRRFAFRHLSIFNTATKSGILECKKSLPKVGMLFFPNSEVKQFLSEALNGIAQIDEMEPGKLLERTWEGRPYDFHRYQKILQTKIQEIVKDLPSDLTSKYPSLAWLEQELIDNLQYQFALVELLRRREWDLIFLGANEVPLALLLFDLDPTLLPPVVFLCHGMLAGDPVMDFWFRFDKTLARGNVEKTYYLKAGVEPENVVNIGSSTLDAFPSSEALLERKKRARCQLGLEFDQTVFIYALTYDIYRADVSDKVLNLIIDSLIVCQANTTLKDPVLFLKYHPAPSDDANFSFSRNQYPLNGFMRLKNFGFSIRILPSLEGTIGAADCFIAHESSTLFQALEASVPTVSIRFDEGLSLPTMGFELYEKQNAHSLCNIAQGSELIGRTMSRLCTLEQDETYAFCKQGWNEIFECGRTEGISRVIEVTSTLLAKKN